MISRKDAKDAKNSREILCVLCVKTIQKEGQMKEFRGKVAVITGGASGIGYALAGRCAQEGMKVVLADIEAPALEQVEQALKESGADVFAVQTDVSQASELERLAQKTLERFGGVHLLFNNAGVGAGTTVWES